MYVVHYEQNNTQRDQPFALVLVASGWMFIKPFLSTKDKRVISIIVPIQVLANIASVFASEAAIGSINWSFWVMFRFLSCMVVVADNRTNDV